MNATEPQAGKSLTEGGQVGFEETADGWLGGKYPAIQGFPFQGEKSRDTPEGKLMRVRLAPQLEGVVEPYRVDEWPEEESCEF